MRSDEHTKRFQKATDKLIKCDTMQMRDNVEIRHYALRRERNSEAKYFSVLSECEMLPAMGSWATLCTSD